MFRYHISDGSVEKRSLGCCSVAIGSYPFSAAHGKGVLAELFAFLGIKLFRSSNSILTTSCPFQRSAILGVSCVRINFVPLAQFLHHPRCCPLAAQIPAVLPRKSVACTSNSFVSHIVKQPFSPRIQSMRLLEAQ